MSTNTPPISPPPPLARDPIVGSCVAVLVVVSLVIELGTWGARNGDVVEHLERATDLARGFQLGEDATRAPLLGVVLSGVRRGLDLLGFEGVGALKAVASALSLAAGAGLLLASAALGEAYGGRSAARWCALFLASSPVLWAWSAAPTSASLAAFFAAFGAWRLATSRSTRDLFWAGCGFGLACATKHQLLFLAPFLLWLPNAQGRAPAWARSRVAFVAFASFLVFSSLADTVAYGGIGRTAPAYLRTNVAPILYASLHPILPEDARLALHDALFDVEASATIREGLPLQRQRPFLWYLSALPRWLPPPWWLLALAAFLTRKHSGPRSPAWRRAALVVALALVGHGLALSFKGAKELRLLFPMVPFVGVLWGGMLARVATSRRTQLCLAPLVAAALAWPFAQLAGALPSGELETRQRHWAYAAAMRELARRPAAEGPLEVVATYDFAIALEGRRGVNPRKPPYSLDLYERLSPAARSELESFLGDEMRLRFRTGTHDAEEAQERARLAAEELGLRPSTPRQVRAADERPAWAFDGPPGALRSLEGKLRAEGLEVLDLRPRRPDRILAHAQSLSRQPSLVRWLSEQSEFALVAAFWDRERSRDLHPLWMLAPASQAAARWPLAHRSPAERMEERLLAEPQPIQLLFLDEEERDLLELVGVEIHPRFARDGFALARCAWRARRDLEAPGDWSWVRRVVSASGESAQLDGALAYGAFDGIAWPADEIRSETVLIPVSGEAGAFSFWVGLRALRPGGRILPQDRSFFPRSPDRLVHVGGGIVERPRDRTLPEPRQTPR